MLRKCKVVCGKVQRPVKNGKGDLTKPRVAAFVIFENRSHRLQHLHLHHQSRWIRATTSHGTPDEQMRVISWSLDLRAKTPSHWCSSFASSSRPRRVYR